MVAKPSRRDLETKEADLIKKEADLLKQLSAESRAPGKITETRARIEPARQAGLAPKAAPVAEKREDKSEALTPEEQDEKTRLLIEKDRQIEALSHEVSKLRNRLLLAETEVERLSSIIDERNKRQMSSYSGSNAAPSLFAKKAQAPAAPAANSAASRSAAIPPASDQQDMQVITVRADKAFLRTGPGEENSPLMTVSRGTRLAVETRSGEWYRVISPAGTRAWVAASVVVFGDIDPSRATRIGGVYN